LHRDPDVREMVLNHASLSAPDRQTAVEWLQDMAAGMSVLVRDRVVMGYLRMRKSVHETLCLTDWSLFDAYQGLRQRGARDEYLFLVRLSAKTPLLIDVEQEIVDRFRSCQEKTLSMNDGEPLVLCAISNGVAVGFPSESTWDRDRLTITFDELLSDGGIEETYEEIDNLTRDVHARPICARHRNNVRDNITSSNELWQKRKLAFPNLSFSPDVESQLASLHSAVLQLVISRLKGLDESAIEWRARRSGAPRWNSKVTSESDSVMRNEILREARRFKSLLGTHELFMLHARFGSAGRIHFRIDQRQYEIEIGYIGNKLPTSKFRT